MNKEDGFGAVWSPECIFPHDGAQNYDEEDGGRTFVNAMTLIVGAVASDGCVIAADALEVIQVGELRKSRQVAEYKVKRSDQPKIQIAGERFAIGAAGAGAWGRTLVEEIGQRAAEATDVRRFSSLVHTVAAGLPGLPGFTMLCIGSDGVRLIEGHPDRAKPARWLLPVDVNQVGWRCIGIPTLANWVMGSFWRREMTVEEVAGVCALALVASSEVILGIDGPFRVEAIRSNGKPWTDEDSERAISAAHAWTRYAKSFPWRG